MSLKVHGVTWTFTHPNTYPPCYACLCGTQNTVASHYTQRPNIWMTPPRQPRCAAIGPGKHYRVCMHNVIGRHLTPSSSCLQGFVAVPIIQAVGRPQLEDYWMMGLFLEHTFFLDEGWTLGFRCQLQTKFNVALFCIKVICIELQLLSWCKDWTVINIFSQASLGLGFQL